MRRIVVLAVALGLALGATSCGKKGPLDRPEPKKKNDEGATALVLPR